MIIRRAVPEDVSELHKMLIDMYSRVEIPASPLSENKILGCHKSNNGKRYSYCCRRLKEKLLDH